jgi:tetratricopeptide (TPR) repeat protein
MRVSHRAGGCLVLLVLVGGVGCAARHPPPDPPVSPAAEYSAAQALVREGCYRCLDEARAIFERLGTWPGARARAFDAAVLLAARDRELGLRALDHLPRAREMAPPSPDGRSALVLAVLEALPWPPAACGPAERDAALLAGGSLRPRIAEWDRVLSAAPREDLLLRYLGLAVRCTWPHLLDTRDPVAPGAQDPPLLRYGATLCAPDRVDVLTTLLGEVPAFLEIDLALAETAMGGGALLTAERHYAAVLGAFPGMLPAAHGLARLHVMLEEYETSLPEYDAVLQAVPDQQDALLGKARALSQLGRPREALPLLDRLIALGTWLLGDAHYWRGWNLLGLGELEAAAASADLALRLMVNARVHMLAGAIAAARTDWDRAVREFEAALPLDETDCDISLSLATARGTRREWRDAATHFERAATCLVDAQDRLRRRLEEIAGAELSPERRERFLARTRAATSQAHAQEGLARFNAAVALVNAGRKAEAVPWARAAAEWPEWHERASAILEQIGP